MKIKIIASLALVTSVMFSQAAFANNDETIILDPDHQAVQILTKDDVLSASSDDYVFEETSSPQSRRSALFAHILDTMAKGSTRAQIDVPISVYQG